MRTCNARFSEALCHHYEQREKLYSWHSEGFHCLQLALSNLFGKKCIERTKSMLKGNKHRARVTAHTQDQLAVYLGLQVLLN